ncbi:hypothetical protein [Flavobacterium sp.]|uniref:hypothetical protein n=1 Tax=Flavobacterium sp. TaxID=239 RepID=UPI002634069A|nr:hypothetical protein [Flavobacterium sp.]
MAKKVKKKELIGLSIILCLISFVIPFFIRESEDKLLDVFSVSLGFVSTTATLITLYIAFKLYDRFGIDTIFIQRRTDKVLELVDLLKGKYMYPIGEIGEYNLGTNRDKIIGIKELPFYKLDKNKLVLVSVEDYNKAWLKIFEIKRSYWLPKKIKKKIEFLEFKMFLKTENSLSKEFIRINFNEVDEKIWSETYPKMTFDEFLSNIDDLVKSIEKWLKKYSNIKLDLNLAEGQK